MTICDNWCLVADPSGRENSGVLVTIMWFLFICAACLVSSVTLRDPGCPAECQCYIGLLVGYKNGYIIKSNSRNMTRIPDLSGLTSNPRPKLLRLGRAISRITQTDFPEGIGITQIILSNNREMELEDGAFSNLHDSLEYLNLEITKIFFNKTLTFLRGLTKLEYLDLSFNNEYHYQYGDSKIVSRLFYGLGLSSLKKMKLYNSNIQSIGPDVFLGIETLEELDLAANQLPGIPDGIARLGALKVLDISNSRFTTLKGKSFVHNRKLMKLEMLYSKLTTIEADAFVGLEKSLQVLDMQYGKLSKFPTDALKNLTALKVLKLKSNPLATIPDGSLSGSFCLSDLYISQTSIKLTRNIFKGQKNCIKSLYLRDMGLSNIPTESLASLQKLDHLFLDENDIKVLRKDSLIGVKASLLVLDKNPLARIEKGAFQNLTYPLYVDLAKTLLEDLHFTLDYSAGTFASINAKGVPLECDCTIARLISQGVSLSGNCNARGTQMDLRDDKLPGYLSPKCPASEAHCVRGLVYLLNVICVLIVSSVRSVF